MKKTLTKYECYNPDTRTIETYLGYRPENLKTVNREKIKCELVMNYENLTFTIIEEDRKND